MSNIPYKQCTGPCRQEYPATTEYWYSEKRSKDGFRNRCRKCIKWHQKEYQQQTEVQEQKKDYNKEYYGRPEVKEQRKESFKQYSKEYYSRPKVKEQRKKYYSRLEAIEQRKEYYSRPKVKQHKKEYNNRPEVQERHKEFFKQYGKEYRNRPEVQERLRVHRINRRAREHSVLGKHSPQQIKNQLRHQKHKCYYCHKRLRRTKGKYVYHIEHTFPLSRVAGTTIPANSIEYIVLACPACNLNKGDKFPWEYPEGGRLL
ncbi:MAG TPA: HNH endonuclease [Ktedonobacteraceae bacterium]|jgi:hypothetical protein|nr:HNH endonuclease [Ktedonobacteraceae bacterium]